MAIAKEVWVADIKEMLFPDNNFMLKSEDFAADTDAKFIHITNSVQLPGGEEDRNHSNTPATAERLVDDEVIMRVHEFTTTPTKIPNIDEIEVNYDKRRSVSKRHTDVIRNLMAKRVAFEWLPTQAANILRCDGDVVVGKVPTATGNRKLPSIEQFSKAAGMLDDMEVPDDGRCAMIPSYWYRYLIEKHWKDLVNMEKVGNAALEEGKIMSLFGFELIKRNIKRMPFYNNAATPVPQLEGTSLTTGNACGLFWHPNFVGRAVAEINFFEDLGNPLYYGDVYSALVRGGGCKNYKDETGVVALVEAAAA